jgi:N-acyl-L-homoserine lactone synthetase
MIKIIEGAQDPKTNPLFNEMFKQRTQVFKDELGWDIPLVNGLDIDVYDDENTVYLVDIDENGHVLGSVRLRATLAPHMMTGSFEAIFPHLSIKSPRFLKAHALSPAINKSPAMACRCR